MGDMLNISKILRKSDGLCDGGFAQGEVGNAPEGTAVQRVEIWTKDADSSAVLLVRSRLGQAEVLEKPVPGAPGIVVVVGEDMEHIFEGGRPSILAEDDTVVCGPAI